MGPEMGSPKSCNATFRRNPAPSLPPWLAAAGNFFALPSGGVGLLRGPRKGSWQKARRGSLPASLLSRLSKNGAWSCFLHRRGNGAWCCFLHRRNENPTTRPKPYPFCLPLRENFFARPSGGAGLLRGPRKGSRQKARRGSLPASHRHAFCISPPISGHLSDVARPAPAARPSGRHKARLMS